MFYTQFNKFTNHSLTWQNNLRNREIAKNSYRALGDMKKAKDFVNNVNKYKMRTDFVDEKEHIIFSSDIAIAPAYSYAIPLF